MVVVIWVFYIDGLEPDCLYREEITRQDLFFNNASESCAKDQTIAQILA
jgi:hypothetical protein